MCAVGTHPLSSIVETTCLKALVPRDNLPEPQFPHLYNLTGLMINYQQILIECLLDTKPDTAHAWCVVEALPQKKQDS